MILYLSVLFVIAVFSAIIGVADSLSMYAGYVDPSALIKDESTSVSISIEYVYDTGEGKHKVNYN